MTNPNVSFDKLYLLMKHRGETFHGLYKKRVITDYGSRLINNGGNARIYDLANIAIHFGAPIEDIVEVIPKHRTD